MEVITKNNYRNREETIKNRIKIRFNNSFNEEMNYVFTNLKIKVKHNLNIIKNSNHFLFTKAAVKDKIRLSQVLV